MRRITVSLDDAIVEVAERDVAAGRAPSVSAWVAAAMRAKAQARAELRADLDEAERRDPIRPDELALVASSVGLPVAIVEEAIRGTRHQRRRRRGAQ